MFSDAQIEAAAKALWLVHVTELAGSGFHLDPMAFVWERVADDTKEFHREAFRKALEAAGRAT